MLTFALNVVVLTEVFNLKCFATVHMCFQKLALVILPLADVVMKLKLRPILAKPCIEVGIRYLFRNKVRLLLNGAILALIIELLVELALYLRELGKRCAVTNFEQRQIAARRTCIGHTRNLIETLRRLAWANHGAPEVDRALVVRVLARAQLHISAQTLDIVISRLHK